MKRSCNDAGVECNAMRPKELFLAYEAHGFLYEAKKRIVQPYISEIRDNWERALHAGESLIWILTVGEASTPDWATLTGWRDTHDGWFSQHLVSSGNPWQSRRVLLAAQEMRLRQDDRGSGQNWFRPQNRFPARVFGTITRTAGDKHAAELNHRYFAAPLDVCSGGAPIQQIHNSSSTNVRQELREFLQANRGRIWTHAGGWGSDDIELCGLNAIYQAVGLTRRRYIFVARNENKEIDAAAIVYRGPLGINFSFLENRCELVTAPDTTVARREAVVQSLLHRVAGEYDGFSPGFIPVVGQSIDTETLMRSGAECIREYMQSIWMRDAYEDWYRHVDSFYHRLDQARMRSGENRARTKK